MNKSTLLEDANELMDHIFMAEIRLNLFRDKYYQYFGKTDLNQFFEQSVIAISLLDSSVAALMRIWDKENKDYPNRISFYSLLKVMDSSNLCLNIREDERFKRVQNLRHTLIAHLARKDSEEKGASIDDIFFVLNSSIDVARKISKLLNLSYKRHLVDNPDPATSAG